MHPKVVPAPTDSPAERATLGAAPSRKYNATELVGMWIGATEGFLGKVIDVLFDDDTWTVRYLVVETGPWLQKRRVLISPISVIRIDWKELSLETTLSFAQVRGSPEVDTDKPVHRQHEMEFFGYYGFPVYWDGPCSCGGTPYSEIVAGPGVHVNAPLPNGTERPVDTHLRSLEQLMGYRLQAQDGPGGRVIGFLINDGGWALTQAVIDMGRWMSGSQVRIPTCRITHVDWTEKIVTVDMTRSRLRQSLNTTQPSNSPGGSQPHFSDATRGPVGRIGLPREGALEKMRMATNAFAMRFFRVFGLPHRRWLAPL